MNDARVAYLHAFAAIFKKRRKMRALKPTSSLRLKRNQNFHNVLPFDHHNDEPADAVVRAVRNARHASSEARRPLAFLR